MSSTIFSNLLGIANLVATDVYIIDDPNEYIEKRLPEKFNKWAIDPDTESCFVTLCEGRDPSSRINVENPINRCHGLLVDYDCKSGIDVRLHGDFKIKPNFVHETKSGGWRAVFLFDHPVLLPDNSTYTEFAKALAAKLSLDKALPGIDMRALKDPRKYYFIGASPWVAWSDRKIGTGVLSECMEAAIEVFDHRKLEARSVPIKEFRDLMAKRHPDVGIDWTRFNYGARTRRFWDPTADNDLAAIITEKGAVCFTGERGFIPMSHKFLLGSEALQKISEEGSFEKLLEPYWIFGKNLYRLRKDRWFALSEGAFRRKMIDEGLQSTMARGAALSEVDQALLYVENHKVLDIKAARIWEGPLVFEGDRKIMNIFDGEVISPASKDAEPPEILQEWIDQLYCMFVLEEDFWRFVMWLKYIYKQAVGQTDARRWGRPPLLILVGPTGNGKTLVIKLLGRLVGGMADPALYLTGGDKFNDGLLQEPIWCFDDPDVDFSNTNRASRRLKELVAKETIIERGMGVSGKPMPLRNPICMNINSTVTALEAFPSHDKTIRDKSISLETKYGWWIPNDYVKPEHGIKGSDYVSPPSDDDWIDELLPHWGRWLLDVEIPSEYSHIAGERFVVKGYVSPGIQENVSDDHWKGSFADVLNIHREEYPEKWTQLPSSGDWELIDIKATELLYDVKDEGPMEGIIGRRPLRSANAFGQYLSHLTDAEMKLLTVTKRILRGYSLYSFIVHANYENDDD